MAKKKTLVPFGIFFIVISLFFIFKFSFVLGALLLATGIIALVYSKKNKFIPIVPAVFSLIFILLIIGFRAILATASQIIIFIDNESIYSSTTALAEFIDYMMYDPYDFLYLFEDLESLPYIYLLLSFICNCLIILDTLSGLSPEIILT